MLHTLITSKTRIKLLLKFFINSRNTSYLRDLANEFGESTNAIRLELNRMEKAGLLRTKKQGNKKLYQSNPLHPFFSVIQQLMRKHAGIDQFVDSVINNLKGLDSAYLIGGFARGQDKPQVELLLFGDTVDVDYLNFLIKKTESLISREIVYKLEMTDRKHSSLHGHPEALLIWADSKDNINQNPDAR